MNFSTNRKLRKLLSLFAVLVLLSSLFAGCKKDKDNSDTSEPNSNLGLEDPIPTESQTQPTETEPVEINENMATVISHLNVRSSPSTQSTVTATLEAGDKVEVTLRKTVIGVEWAYVTIVSSGDTGWICMDFVEMDYPQATEPNAPEETKPEDSTEPTTNTKGVVTANGLNIRSEPSADGEIKGTYNKGDVVTILEIKDGWGRTNKGWIKMQYVNTTANNTDKKDEDKDKDNNDKKDDNDVTGNGSTTVLFKGIVTAKELNVRSEASTNGERVGSLKYGARVEIFEKNGNWGRTKDGWISLDYVYQDGTTGANSVGAIITGDQLNIRSGPGTGYKSVGSLKKGEHVTILAQFTYGETTWGCIKNGWICMDYVRVDGTETHEPVTGTVTGDQLNIRSGPGTGYKSVGTLNTGDEVTILYQITVDGKVWGNIKEGWICMDYVELN